ncbi:MAG: Crp/Fnr family transcriptional regulator [candidate division NC10 bacterium]|nr:Crp/Fnr family transcriptional regulator [candidate division NC10 bacterium]
MPLTFLTAGELFQGISRAEDQKISSLCSEKRYRRGTTIFSEGDPSDALYVLKTGLVKLISHSEEKKMEMILHILKPAEIFGELLLSEETRPFAAIAIEDVLVTVISQEHFLELLSSVPTVALNFVTLLSKRLARVEKVLADSGHTWSYHRLAKVLLQLSEKYGEEVPRGTLIKLRLTHQDLANLIGTTRETATTQLNRFERMGLLTRHGRHLIITPSRLTEFIHTEELRFSNLNHSSS